MHIGEVQQQHSRRGEKQDIKGVGVGQVCP